MLLQEVLFDFLIYENDTERPYDTFYEGEYDAVGYYVLDDYDECIKEVDLFLPYVDNWAVCDIMSHKI